MRKIKTICNEKNDQTENKIKTKKNLPCCALS